MEARLEALLELCFYTKPPNFGVETHMKAPAGDALRPSIPRAMLISDRSLGGLLATGCLPCKVPFSGKFFLPTSFYFWNNITYTHNFGA
jgi:hypothetical protein